MEQISEDELAVRVSPQTALGATSFEFHVEIDFTENRSGTEVSWRAKAKVSGVLNSIGRRILPAILGSQVDAVLQAASERARA